MSQGTNENTDSAREDRRSFLGAISWLFVGFVGLITGVAGIVYALFPAFSAKRGELWQSITAISNIPEGKPTKYSFTLVERAGWAETNTQQALWVMRKGETLNVFSAVCPHEGCTVNHEQNGFVCRCHLSRWNDDGSKVSGPTARGLDKLEYRIANKQLEVKYQNFKRGVEQQIPLT